MHVQELGYGDQIFYSTQVLTEQIQMATLKPSTVILHRSIPAWDDGSRQRDRILQGISQIPFLFSSTTAQTTQVTTPSSYKIHQYNHLSLRTMVSIPVLCQMIKIFCRLYILASTPTNTLVCLVCHHMYDCKPMLLLLSTKMLSLSAVAITYDIVLVSFTAKN